MFSYVYDLQYVHARSYMFYIPWLICYRYKWREWIRFLRAKIFLIYVVQKAMLT
jgi:hypothetical protein